MNKRKIDINQLKRKALKGKKYRTINVKYAIVLSYFKQKEIKDKDIFQVDFFPLIQELLNQITSLELVYKIQNQRQQPLCKIEIPKESFKLNLFNLKGLSNQFPIKEIIDCICAQKDQTTNNAILGILKNKLMDFFKNLRKVYHDFCSCDGQTSVLQNSQLKILYQLFKIEWSKSQERAKLSAFQKLEKKICRSLFFLGIIIQNNISRSIDQKQRKKLEELVEPETKSEKKKNITPSMYYQINPTYSFYSAELMSNFSISLKSQKSNQESFNNMKYDHSEKSQKIVRKSKSSLWEKAEIKNLNFAVYPKSSQFVYQLHSQPNETINFLSNDVQNKLIERAFNIEKIGLSYYNPNYMGMTSSPSINPCDYMNYHYLNYNTQNSYTQNYYPYSQQQHFADYQLSPTNSSSGNQNPNRKTIDFMNLVETRKNSERFTTSGRKYP